MPVLLLDRSLFASAKDWVPNYSLDVNDPASVLFLGTETENSGSMLVHNALAVPWGGALISNKRPLMRLNGNLLRFSAWHFNFRFIGETYDRLARFENDLKTCIRSRPAADTPIRNVANYSTQWNRDTGELEIDHDPPGWVGCGFFPCVAATAPDEWHSLDFRYAFDEVAGTFSILSIQWDEEFYAMPVEHRNIRLQETNWEECAMLQIQNEGYDPGTVLIEYDDGVMAWSDAPISARIPDRESYE